MYLNHNQYFDSVIIVSFMVSSMLDLLFISYLYKLGSIFVRILTSIFEENKLHLVALFKADFVRGIESLIKLSENTIKLYENNSLKLHFCLKILFLLLLVWCWWKSIWCIGMFLCMKVSIAKKASSYMYFWYASIREWGEFINISGFFCT